MINALYRLGDALIKAGIVKEPAREPIVPAPLCIEHVIVYFHTMGNLCCMVHQDVHCDLEGSNHQAENQEVREIADAHAIRCRDRSLVREDPNRNDDEGRENRGHVCSATTNVLLHSLFDCCTL